MNRAMFLATFVGLVAAIESLAQDVIPPVPPVTGLPSVNSAAPPTLPASPLPALNGLPANPAGGLSGGDGDGQIEYIGYGRGAAGGALIGLASSEASGWYDVVAEPVARVANRGHREGDVGHRASVGLAVARLWLQRGCDRFKEGGRAGRRQADKQAGRQAAGRQAFRHQEGTRR